ncbi:MAG: gamma-glutamylcyclotransferase family protein [Actinomycetota bacterium]
MTEHIVATDPRPAPVDAPAGAPSGAPAPRTAPGGHDALAGEFAALPYPGHRPSFSFAQLEDRVYALTPDASAPSGWRVRGSGQDLDAWLVAQKMDPMSARVPVLAYGSNACPAKIVDLTIRRPPFTGAAVLLRCQTPGLAAAWCAGTRQDGSVPATLVAAAVTETHAVMFCTRPQMRALDACEGRRAGIYALARIGVGEVVLEDGARVERCLAYVGARSQRMALADAADRPLLVAEHDQDAAAAARRAGAATWTAGLAAGLDAEPVSVAWPDPQEWRTTLFVYGTLQPGGRLWGQLEPFAASVRAEPATLAGTAYDTGWGYPGARLTPGPGVVGTVVHLHPGLVEEALAHLDDIEGVAAGHYRRHWAVLTDGTACWVYLYEHPVQGLPVLTTRWGTGPGTDQARRP